MGNRKCPKFGELNPKVQSAICFVVTMAISLFVFKFVFLIGYVPSASMEPTLKTGSLCLGLRTVNVDNCDVGDILIFKHDGGIMVKRVAAVGGDEFVSDTGKTFVVPEDHFLMLGDNKEESYDSRYWDNPYVDKEDVVAKLILP